MFSLDTALTCAAIGEYVKFLTGLQVHSFKQLPRSRAKFLHFRNWVQPTCH